MRPHRPAVVVGEVRRILLDPLHPMAFTVPTPQPPGKHLQPFQLRRSATERLTPRVQFRPQFRSANLPRFTRGARRSWRRLLSKGAGENPRPRHREMLPHDGAEFLPHVTPILALPALLPAFTMHAFSEERQIHPIATVMLPPQASSVTRTAVPVRMPSMHSISKDPPCGTSGA